MIENPATGEHVDFVSEDPDLLVMDVAWTRPGHRAVEHLHPGMEERWTVIEGRAAWKVDGVEVEGGPGTTVVAPPGRRHIAWNPTDEAVRLRIEMRPALRWAEFVRRLFAGEDAAVLLAEFSDEIALPPREP